MDLHYIFFTSLVIFKGQEILFELFEDLFQELKGLFIRDYVFEGEIVLEDSSL